jgi:hypothetical protein
MNLNAQPAPPRPRDSAVTVGGLLLLGLLTIGPLLLEPRPAAFLEPFSSATTTLAAEGMVLGLMGLTLAVRAWRDRGEAHPFALALLFAVFAGALAAIHWCIVDSDPIRLHWQREDIYLPLLNHQGDAPHRYRPLPYGFVRLLERVTHDWLFSAVAYRWFFTWWFLCASYRLARRWLPPARALLAVVPVVLLYPLSVWYYWGQLADPLSHFLFLLSLIYLLEDRPWPLAASLALGIAAKETVVLVVAVYLACRWRRGWRAWLTTGLLGAVCTAAYLAARLPQGWRPGLRNVNGLDALMIGTNLGIGEPIASGAAPVWENYLHLFLFVGIFLPPLIRRWRRIDPGLRTVCATLTPLLVASNVCFGWLYESRNYMPLVPLLATAVLSGKLPSLALQACRTRGDLHKPEAQAKEATQA